jgi:glycine reductase
VTVAGFLPRAQEAVLDLSGPAAELTPFSRLRHVVIVPHPVADPDWTEVERALRAGALRLAAQLAQAAVSEPADEVVDLEPRSSRHRPSGLPVVGVIINLQTQGAFKDVFVYGNSYSAGLPTLIDPYEMDLGAVVSGQYGHPGLKNPTYVHQNNPVVRTMRERDGVDLNFGGVIISPEPVELPRKELVAAHAGRLAELAGWDGAVVTKEGGGNADLDMALKMDELERRGMAGVGIFAEMSGTDGAGPPLVSPPKVASAMVSAGNYDQRIQLPAMCRAIGGEVLALTSQPVTAAHEVAVAAIYGSLSPVGAGHIQAVAR